MGGASTSQTCGVGEANGPIRDPRVIEMIDTQAKPTIEETELRFRK